ncbi:polysaccharide lyase family 14 [Brachionus plicatilis]|uniref:Polysaccharide lyase family 14 n=1 Tax=Brachionus plicatilis TaxID=10195 RepID=A0A3M7Q6Y9_BRAPC|nr:polysaccharide lyase family 14 [Brachionus plicatilis]
MSGAKRMLKKPAEALLWVGDFANFNYWPIGNSYLADNREIVNDPKGSGKKALKVKYPAGSYSSLPGNKGGTGFFVWPFGTNIIQHATLEYEVLFPTDFDWVKGGKLPGFFGGKTNCNGGDMALDCFSLRFMFGSNGNGYATTNVPISGIAFETFFGGGADWATTKTSTKKVKNKIKTLRRII